jgi:hypothetical protein
VFHNLGQSVPPAPQGSFSKELIEQCIACFKEEDNVTLSEEEAIAVLLSLGSLFLAFAVSERRDVPRGLSPRDGAEKIL